VVSSGGCAAVSGGTPCNGAVTDGWRGGANSCETESTVGRKPTAPGSTATALADGCIGTAAGRDDKVPTNRVVVAGSTLRTGAGLDVTAPTRGSNKGSLIRPTTDHGNKVEVSVGLLEGNRPRTLGSEGTRGNGGEEGPKSAVAGKPLAAGLNIGPGMAGVESCADGVVDRGGEGDTEITGANWPTRLGDGTTGWVVAKETAAGAATDERIGASCADDGARFCEAAAPDRIWKVAKAGVGA
jgi:hypothetical protein